MKSLTPFYIVAMLIAATSAWAVTPDDAKYAGHCAYGLSKGMQVTTDCSITWTKPGTNELYCFASQTNKEMFAKDLSANILKADAEYTKIAANNMASTHLQNATKQMELATRQMNEGMQGMKHGANNPPQGNTTTKN